MRYIRSRSPAVQEATGPSALPHRAPVAVEYLQHVAHAQKLASRRIPRRGGALGEAMAEYERIDETLSRIMSYAVLILLVLMVVVAA